jgi:hypothetical protein
MFKFTCFAGLLRFVTVAFRSGDVRIRLPLRRMIVLALPSAEMLIGKAQEPSGSPGSTSNVMVTFCGGIPF